ncbi:hypothetical protein AWN68_04430 [Roseivirga echinicomitans]|uniref:6-bladed beta-propeller n=2 Tax=Roseivirga echinicomitans TaxID=296218 RepID=A0A150XJG9_9BACT|nr:hypothetical protein AWN68_04430 [Roseivirga echinicomitans]
MNRIIHVAFFVLILFSCSKEKNPEWEKFSDGIGEIKKVSFAKRDIKSTRQLKGELLELTNYLSFPRTLVVNNGTLIITDINNNAMIHIIDLKTNQYLKSLGKKGYGPNEVMSVGHSLSLKPGEINGFWTYDMTQLRMSFFDYTKQDTIKEAMKQFVFRTGEFKSFRVTWTNRNTLLGLPYDGGPRLIEYDTTGAVLNEIGDYKGVLDDKYRSGTLAQLFQGVVRANPKGDKFIHSSIYVDRLNLYDLNEDRILEITGPLNIDPIFEEHIIQNNSTLGINTEEAYQMYSDSYLSKDRIYGLFSGKKWMGSPSGVENSNLIYVFNLEGEILEALELDYTIRAFTIDPMTNTIYGVSSSKEADIVKFSF